MGQIPGDIEIISFLRIPAWNRTEPVDVQQDCQRKHSGTNARQ
jgi:hypothetical protein